MKKMIITMVLALATSMNIFAFSRSVSQKQSYFLTDKMAYELNLSQSQIDDVYEINYDFYRSIDNKSRDFSIQSERRLRKLSYVLSSYQYNLFRSKDYFYYPISVVNRNWNYKVYTRYSKNKYYVSRPSIYSSYRGAHANLNSYYSNKKYDGKNNVNNRNNSSNSTVRGNNKKNNSSSNISNKNYNRTNSSGLSNGKDKSSNSDNASRRNNDSSNGARRR